MNFKLKKILLPVLFCICLLTFSIYFVNSIESKSEQNLQKIVGSKMPGSEMSFNWESFKDIKHLIDFGSKLVVKVTILDDGKTLEEDAPTAFPGEDAIKIHRTLFDVDVDEVLYGEYANQNIVFEQMGVAGSDVGETKVKKGDKVILFLEKNRYGYSAMGQEQGIYRIGEDEKINAMTDNVDLINKYDKKEVKEFIKEIKKMMKQ